MAGRRACSGHAWQQYSDAWLTSYYGWLPADGVQGPWMQSVIPWQLAHHGQALPAPAAKPKSGKSTKECMICGEPSTTQCSSQECSSRQTSADSFGRTILNFKPPYCCESCVKRVDGMRPLCKNCFEDQRLSMKISVCKHCNIETMSVKRCSSGTCSNIVCCSKCLVVWEAVNFCPVCKPQSLQ